MAGGFLRKLLSPSAALATEVKEALAELERLAQQRSELAGPIVLLGEVLPKLYQDPIRESPPALTPNQAAVKLSEGLPLLRGERLEMDVKAFRRRWFAVCAVVQRHQDPDAGRRLGQALRRDQLDPLELMQDTLNSRPESVHAKAELLDLDIGLLATVLRLALFPLLAHADAALAPLRDGVRWHHGHCPTCGSWPLLGEFRGLEQTRFLRCGLCAAEWEFRRALCPFCGTTDHNLLGYLHVEGEEARYRASTCDACRGYVKMVSTLTALTAPQLLVAELATMHLDLVAAQRDYVGQP